MSDESVNKLSCMAEQVIVVCGDEAFCTRRARLVIDGKVCSDSFQVIIDECTSRWGSGRLKKLVRQITGSNLESDYEWFKDDDEVANSSPPSE